jgi:hypothetical protein
MTTNVSAIYIRREQMNYSDWTIEELSQELNLLWDRYNNDLAHFEDEMQSAGAPYMCEANRAHLDGLLDAIDAIQIEILWRDHDKIERDGLDKGA